MSDLTPSPDQGRRPQVVDIGGRRYRVTPLPPRAALRVSFRVAKLLGDSIASLLSGAGLELKGLKGPDGEPMRASLADIITSEKARGALVAKLVEGLADMTPDDLDDLVVELLVGSLHEPRLECAQGNAWIAVVNEEMLDRSVPDPWALLRLAQANFMASAFPTSAGADTETPPA